MNRDDMLRLFETHREAEAERDFDAILATFTEDCFLETVPLGLRSEGKAAARAAYEGYFTAFPDLSPDDQGMAFGDDVIVVWGALRGTSGGDWLGVPPSGGSFAGTKSERRPRPGNWQHRLAPIAVSGHSWRCSASREVRQPGAYFMG